jgi:hypothetical protein
MSNTTPTNSFDTVATGRGFSDPFVDVFAARDPTPQDINYPIQKKWFNTNSGAFWILESFSFSGGLKNATWVQITSGSVASETLTTDDGHVVAPISNNINVLGDGTYITTTGNPATATVTIEAADGLAQVYTEDVGSARPELGNLNILGGTGITTVGSGSTVLITAGSEVATTFIEDTGSANPIANVLNVVGGPGISTSGSGNTITITNSSSSSITFDADAGTATPTGGVIVMHGSGTITTSAAGNTVTFTGSSGGFTTINRRVFTTPGTSTYIPTVGMVQCIVECCGGGGAGGGAKSLNGGSFGGTGTGGGAAGYCSKLFTAAMIGASQPVIVGVGGTGVAGANGNPGTNTTFLTMTANGGLGGIYSLVRPYSAGIPGSSASGGDYNFSGGYSGPASIFTLGFGGSSFFGGAGGQSVGVSNGNGYNAGSYGSGGGGATPFASSTSSTGGNGSSGIVIITEYLG